MARLMVVSSASEGTRLLLCISLLYKQLGSEISYSLYVLGQSLLCHIRLMQNYFKFYMLQKFSNLNFKSDKFLRALGNSEVIPCPLKWSLLLLQGIYYGLSVKCLPQHHIFKFLDPSRRLILGK